MAARTSRPVPLGRTRLANPDDVSGIIKLVTSAMALNFNINSTKAVGYLIEQSILSICQLDVKENVVGFLATKDYPPVPAILPAFWEDFIWNKYKAVDLNARNTLFLHLLCFEPVYGRDVVDKMLKSLYMYDPYLNYIAMMKPFPDYQVLYTGQARCEASFKKTMSLERGVSCDRLPTLWIADRKDVCPRLRIRRAVEEDNDDIIPIIERHSTALRELYGDFYVSEIISRHPESERVLLVCEDKELAVGVLCLNTQINYDALMENYDLSPYAGLKKIGACDKDSTLLREESALFFEGEVEYKSRNASVMKRQSRGDFKIYEPELPDYVESILEDEDDSETKEYNIVNIDHCLLYAAAYTEENINMQDEKSTSPEQRNMSPFQRRAPYKKQKEKKCIPIYPDPRLQFPEAKRYSGEPNAFLLELFAMHPDYDERHGFDLLEVAYEMFPDRDYCIAAVPSGHPSFPLLDHFTLVSPVKFRRQFVKDSLFVAHVNSVKGDLTVRRAEEFDVNSVDRILRHFKNKTEAMSYFHHSMSSSLVSSFLLLSQNQPVGLVIVGPLQETSVRITYDLDTEPSLQGTDGMIVIGVMSPVLEVHTRWYLRELIRQTQYRTLFWTCSPLEKKQLSPEVGLISLASHMVPVRPRRYTPNMVDPDQKLSETKPLTQFALWYVERPMTSLPKVPVNTSIVVVGASCAGLSFLETLLLGPKASYLLFTNITLVSEYGLPAVAEVMKAAETCVPRRSSYPDTYVKKLPLHYYVDVVAGTMVKIDRKKKCIYLKDGGVKYYDDLVLTCGRKFQQPNYTDKPEVRDYLNPKLCNRISMGDPRYKPDDVIPPSVLYENVMIINTRYEADVCLNRLLQMIEDDRGTPFALSSENPVVVYGDCLDVYSCMAALLEIGVSPYNITFVEPFPAEDNPESMRIDCFNNENIDAIVQGMISSLGIKIYRKCYLYDWTASESRVDMLWFRTYMHVSKLPCFALFHYGIRAMDLRAFKAVNECGLVYNDGIVVGTGFETNDPNIYAAGSCTKYSRRLLTTLHQRDYCSKDVGESLGYMYLKRLDPYLAEANIKVDSSRNSNISFARWEPVMTFESPVINSATLPGPLHYMTVQKPGRKIPNAIKALLPNQGPALETNKYGNYFQLQFNALYCIESLCCLSKKSFPKDAFSQLYGHHEARFNKLMYRYQSNEIDDLFEYFTQPWTTALYQEPVQQLYDNLDDKAGSEVREYIESEFGDLFKEARPDSVAAGVARMDNYERQEKLRKESYNVWSAMDGDELTWKVLIKYFRNNTKTHPYYAIPDPTFMKNC